MTKALRPGKVLIDWSQNDPHKTTVCVYSLRALQRPTVSTPLSWEEVQHGARSRRRELQLSLEPQRLLARIAREGDLHAPLLELEQRLPDLSGAVPARFYEPPRAGSSAGRQANKERAHSGELRTRAQLYEEARKLGIEGRSKMSKAQLQRAVDARKR